MAPWEQLPGCAPEEIRARAQNVAPFQRSGHSLEVAGRFGSLSPHRQFLLARIIGDQSEGNWVLRDGYRFDEPKMFSGQEQLKLPYRLRTKRRGDFPFGRLFCFDARSPLAWVGVKGFGCWLSSQGRELFENTAPFRLPLKKRQSLFDFSASQVRELLEAELARSNSDVHFARHWFEMNNEDRQLRAVRTQRGSMTDLHSLLRAVIRLEIEKLAPGHESVWCVSLAEGRSSSQSRPVGNPYGFEVLLSLRLRMWERLLLGFFEPSLDGALLARHRCVRRWRENLADRAGRYTLFEVPTLFPSHHERLEAALQLRDWARGKIAPRKLKLLLGSI